MEDDSQPTCPLCMEMIEFDDVSFFPCQCGYQICRFCWHRILSSENGLCPACRKEYSSSPDRFQPVTYDSNKHKKKAVKKKDVDRRALVDLRVIQKNLIFVIGLSPRIASVEELKKFIHFGKYGKILKVVVSQQQPPTTPQPPPLQTSSAYITYSTQTEALRAIKSTNNIIFDNKLIKTSLGTTKYCSYYLKSLNCTKVECMYLHSLGEEEASFTKEDMLQGKHCEYEKKLMEEYEEAERRKFVSSNVVETQQQNGGDEEEEEEVEEKEEESKFDPFNETNKIFEELISIHAASDRLAPGASGVGGAAFSLDPTPLFQPNHYFQHQPAPPGFNWLPQQNNAKDDYQDPAILYSRLCTDKNRFYPPPPGF